MPVSPVQQFLTPQRAGEEVPDSQIATQGPFTAELTQPYFVAPNVKPSGFGGPGAALLHLANNFLAGASQGRLRQFQQSELTKKEHERNYDATVQHVMDSPDFTTAFKNQTMENALATKSSAGLAALGGGKGGKNDHPLVGVMRNVFNHVVGPGENVKHTDIGPEHVSDLISQMHDPANRFSAADASEQAGTAVGKVIDQMKAAAAQSGVPLYREDVPNHAGFAEAVRPLTNERLNPLANEAISSRLAGLPSRPSPEAIRKANLPVSWVYRDNDGAINKTSVRISPEGQVQDLSGAPIPMDSPIIKNGSTAGAWDVATAKVAGQKDVQKLRNEGSANVQNLRNAKEQYTLRQDANNNWVRIQTGGFGGVPNGSLVAPMGAPTQPPPGAQPLPTPDVTQTPAGSPSGTPASDMEAKARQAAAVAGVDPDLYASVVKTESNFDPTALSPKGAIGLAQLMPDTAKALGVADPSDPDQNLAGGAKLLKQLMVKYNGDVPKALAAYNAGEGMVDSGKTLPDETKAYIPKVLAGRDAYRNAVAAAPGTPPAGAPKANPREGVVSTGAAKSSANAPVTWTPEQERLAQVPVEPGKRRDEFLQSFPLQDRTLIKSIADYDYKAPGGTKGALTSPRVSSMIAAAKIYNPSFNSSDYDNRAALKKNFMFGGKTMENITSLNTALVHSGGLYDAAEKLDNSAFRKYNTFANWLQKESGSPQAKAFQTDRTAVSEELARALKGGLATKDEVRQWESNIDTSDSPAQLRAALSAVGSILGARIGEQQATYERGMGEPPVRPFISPKAQQALSRLTGGGASGQGTTPPANQPPPMPTTFTQADIGKVFLSPNKGRIKITAVNPQNPAQFRSEAVQ